MNHYPPGYGYTGGDSASVELARVEQFRARTESRLHSRKLWVAVCYFCLICILGIFGAVPWETLLFNPAGGLGVIVMAYLGVQGVLDAVRRWY